MTQDNQTRRYTFAIPMTYTEVIHVDAENLEHAQDMLETTMYGDDGDENYKHYIYENLQNTGVATPIWDDIQIDVNGNFKYLMNVQNKEDI